MDENVLSGNGKGGGNSALPSKVMIAVNTYPGHGYCREEFVERLKEIRDCHGNSEIVIAWNGKKRWGFKGLQVINYNPKPGEKGIDILLNKSNLLRNWFLKGDYTHFFSIESDIIPPVNVLNQLLSREKDIVSGMYFIHTQEYKIMKLEDILNSRNQDVQWQAIKGAMSQGIGAAIVIRQKQIPTVWVIDGTRSRLAELNDFFPLGGLKRVYSAGMGCLLARREVVEDIEFKVNYGSAQNQFTDFCFHAEAYDLGYEAFVDTGIWCKHLHKDFDDRIFKTWFNVETYQELIESRS